MEQPISFEPINFSAGISFFAAILALIGFCVGLLPIPFSTFLCDPFTILGGLFSAITGLIALRQIRITGENGRFYALFGLWVGGFITLATLCFVSAGILVFPYFREFIQAFWTNIQSQF